MADQNNTTTTTDQLSKIHELSPVQPPIPTSSNDKTNHKEEEKEEETIREPKRRKNCPMALEYMEEFTPSNPGFSFTFDTQFTTCSPSEVTPKFGSFNPELTMEDKDKDSPCLQGSKHKEAAPEEEEEQEEEEEKETFKHCSILGSMHGSKEIECKREKHS